MTSVQHQSVPTREERSAQLRKSERSAERDQLRDMLVTMAWCFAFTLAGLVLMACAMHTTDEKWGQILFWTALVANNGGVMGTLLFAYHRGQERGDW